MLFVAVSSISRTRQCIKLPGNPFACAGISVRCMQCLCVQLLLITMSRLGLHLTAWCLNPGKRAAAAAAADAAVADQ